MYTLLNTIATVYCEGVNLMGSMLFRISKRLLLFDRAKIGRGKKAKKAKNGSNVRPSETLATQAKFSLSFR